MSDKNCPKWIQDSLDWPLRRCQQKRFSYSCTIGTIVTFYFVKLEWHKPEIFYGFFYIIRGVYISPKTLFLPSKKSYIYYLTWYANVNPLIFYFTHHFNLPVTFFRVFLNQTTGTTFSKAHSRATKYYKKYPISLYRYIYGRVHIYGYIYRCY